MKTSVAFAIAALAAMAALTAPVVATASPHHVGGSRVAAAAKPTGTIFFLRTDSKGRVHSASMTPSGSSVRILAGNDRVVLPAPAKHELVYATTTTSGRFALDVATYKEKLKHSTTLAGLGQLISVSTNGKDIGSVATNSAGKDKYVVRTIKGKVVSTLFTTPVDEDAVYEAWNSTGSQVAVLSQNRKTERSSLKIYSVHGTLIRTLVKTMNGGTFLAWSKTNTIAYGVFNSVDVVASTGGTPTTLFADTTDNPLGLSYSPNGKFLAYGTTPINGGGGDKVWVGNADGTGRHVISHNGSSPRWG